MQTIAEFIKTNQLNMSATRVPGRTDRSASDWDKSARHFVCHIWQEGFGNQERLTLQYSQGSAHTKNPTLPEVLDCLAMDASSVDNARNFEDWCSELGYDTDSRKAEGVYDACIAQAAELKRLLGKAYPALLYETERQ